MSSENGVPLREFIERIFDEKEEKLRLVAQSLEHRLETLNALRSDVLKDRDLFLSKSVYEEMHAALAERVNKLESWQARIVGAGIVLMGLSAILGAVISHLITK